MPQEHVENAILIGVGFSLDPFLPASPHPSSHDSPWTDKTKAPFPRIRGVCFLSRVFIFGMCARAHAQVTHSVEVAKSQRPGRISGLPRNRWLENLIRELRHWRRGGRRQLQMDEILGSSPEVWACELSSVLRFSSHLFHRRNGLSPESLKSVLAYPYYRLQNASHTFILYTSPVLMCSQPTFQSRTLPRQWLLSRTLRSWKQEGGVTMSVACFH